MIEFEQVRKTFASHGPGARGRDVTAVRDVSLSVPAGDVCALVGPNGAGKTTLFALALGFLRPDGGAVRVEGAEPRAWLRAHGAAYLPERFDLPDRWRVRPALEALARLERFGRREAAARASAVIDRFGLETHADAAVGTLSRGLLQRLGLAQAALAERRLVVLDEPTQGLDPLWRVRFRAFVGELAGEGRTVLVASHDLGEVERMADQVVLLDDGDIRDVLELDHGAGEARGYRLELAEPVAAVSEIFPGSKRLGEGGAVYQVHAVDPAELSGRLAALIEAAGVIVSVTPAAERLEERVRRALGEE